MHSGTRNTQTRDSLVNLGEVASGKKRVGSLPERTFTMHITTMYALIVPCICADRVRIYACTRTRSYLRTYVNSLYTCVSVYVYIYTQCVRAYYIYIYIYIYIYARTHICA
jgi:hypothetical protein